jgi:formylmethanofuran dehydrogenase subunit E-like metal-binding protein
MSIRLNRLSLKDVHIVSTDGYVSDVNDVTKDVVSSFKDEMLALSHR